MSVESLQRRIERFFAENPHEWLTSQDMVVKFSRPFSSIEQAISALRARGVQIERVGVYRLGNEKTAK